MTKTYEIPFSLYPDKVIYKIRVTDKEEPRDGWKRTVAVLKASEKYNKEHSPSRWTGVKYLIRSEIREI